MSPYVGCCRGRCSSAAQDMILRLRVHGATDAFERPDQTAIVLIRSRQYRIWHTPAWPVRPCALRLRIGVTNRRSSSTGGLRPNQFARLGLIKANAFFMYFY